jgi:hypothetical protein
MAVRRMVQAGITPVTWIAVAAEWQRDWARHATAGSVGAVLVQHAGGTGIALNWERQLLANK